MFCISTLNNIFIGKMFSEFVGLFAGPCNFALKITLSITDPG